MKLLAAAPVALALLADSANATTLLGVDVFEDGKIILGVTGVSGGMIQFTGATGTLFSDVNVTVTGDSLGDLTLTGSASLAVAGAAHELEFVATQSNIVPTSTNLAFTNNFSATFPGAFVANFANSIDPLNRPFFGAAIASQSFTVSPAAATVPGNTTLASLTDFAETIVMDFDVGGGSVSGTNSMVAGVPEPSTWALLLLGFVFLAFASRRGLRPVL
jgi:hypothetical protein